MQWMNCEKRRNKSALPQSARHLSQYEKQEDDSDAVQKNICEMMSGRLQTVQLTIQHVRNDRERMPVTTYSVRKGPKHALRRKPCGDLSVLVNILWVVVGDELVRYGLTENQPGDPGENSTNPESPPQLRDA